MQQWYAAYIETLAEPLKKPLALNWQRYLNALNSHGLSLEPNEDLYSCLWRVLSVSEYTSKVYDEFPDLVTKHFANLKQSFHLEQLNRELSEQLEQIDNFTDLQRVLRQFRKQSQAEIIFRFVNNGIEFSDHLKEQSYLALACIQCTVDWLYENLATKWGYPANSTNQQQPFVVIALGKLGALELNLSSDIDLMFAYPESGETQGETLKISNEKFFTLLGQQFIEALSSVTEHGHVFRVDMRLRPFGSSGALVMNYAQLENYYQCHGRDWERYALVKAKVVTGGAGAKKKFAQTIEPFVYRRYLDYGAFESLRRMKKLIEEDVKLKKKENNIKLGAGGIRQIEFIVQAFQLIRGGHEPKLKKRSLLEVLPLLFKQNYLQQNAFHELQLAYIFLRKTEHCLQLIRDEQTHALPINIEDQARLYFALEFDSYSSFMLQLNQHIANVTKHFSLISQVPKIPGHVAKDPTLTTIEILWEKVEDKDFVIDNLTKLQFTEVEEIYKILWQFKQSSVYKKSQERALKRLDTILPVILTALHKAEATSSAYVIVLRLIKAIMRRSAYLAMLVERPEVLDIIVKVCLKSDWIAEQLTKYPLLIDELLRPPFLEVFLSKDKLATLLEEKLEAIAEDDLETNMEYLRHFKLIFTVHLSVYETLGKDKDFGYPLAFNNLAEVILAKVYDLSLIFMINHYKLNCTLAELKDRFPFAIIAYGNLGGRELSYQSDLDLVFVFEDADDSNTKLTDSLSKKDFALRLAQRIIHMLSTHSTSGKIYDVDVRLRPSGHAGLLVSKFSAYKNYIMNEAWIFEHQALIRARCIVGAQSICDMFEQFRCEILASKRDDDNLKLEIKNMRQKMSKQKSPMPETSVKTMLGGMIDIEFIVQYLVLKWSYQHKNLLNFRKYADLIQNLQQLGLLDDKDSQILINTYTSYQTQQRRELLQLGTKQLSEEIAQNAILVQAIWDRVFAT